MKKLTLLTLLLISFTAYAQKFDKKINQLSANYESDIIELRHWFHENAELSNREFKTAKRIAEELKKIGSTPGTLTEVLNNLESDHDWLLKGDVFTPDVIDTWIQYKREREIAELNLRPHPYEFYMYYDL